MTGAPKQLGDLRIYVFQCQFCSTRVRVDTRAPRNSVVDAEMEEKGELTEYPYEPHEGAAGNSRHGDYVRATLCPSCGFEMRLERSEQVKDDLKALPHLTGGWDGEGAPAPNERAIELANEIAAYAREHDIEVMCVDADVLGGIAVHLRGRRDRRAWVSCLNNGQCTYVLCDPEKRIPRTAAWPHRDMVGSGAWIDQGFLVKEGEDEMYPVRAFLIPN
jgi:hypothetical protein